VAFEDKNKKAISKPSFIEHHPYFTVIVCGLILLVLVSGDTALGIVLNGDLNRGTFAWISAAAIVGSTLVLLIVIKVLRARRK
jgi:hypothetical protein